jgi:hypothetical protein
MADLVQTPMWDGDQGNAVQMEEELWVRSNYARRRCLDELGIYFILVSGWRSNDHQVRLRIQNCGPTHFDIYQKSPLLCHPVTAIPGTSDHEKGKAGDWSPGPRSIPAANAIWVEAGLLASVKSEDWHWILDPNRGPLPELPAPTPSPQPEEENMKVDNDFLIKHRDRGEFLVNGVTKLASHMPNPDTVAYAQGLYFFAGKVLEDHRADVDGGTALIDFRIVNVVATQ